MRTWKPLFGLTTIVGILVIGILVLKGGKPASTPINSGFARALYLQCQGVMTSIDYSATYHPDHPQHPGLHLGTAPGIHGYHFGDLFDNNKLIGVIKNDNLLPSTPAEDVGDAWKAVPAKLVCVFMGGDQQGMFAYLVWQTQAGAYQGVQREVVARFHMQSHDHDRSQWDTDVEEPDKGGQAPLDSVGVNSTMVPASQDNGLFGTRGTGGPGTWYTCATNTCCKVL
jgi:hypothetical protein